MIQKVAENFKSKEQQLFIASFYCYLNYDSKKEFVIDFDTVWKWCGFSRKSDGKRLLEKHFKENIDYKIYFTDSIINNTIEPSSIKPAPPIGGAGFTDDISKNFHDLIETDVFIDNLPLTEEYKKLDEFNKKTLVEMCRTKKIKVSGSKDEIIKRIIEHSRTTLYEKPQNNETRGGQNKEKIMLTVHTFKKFCLKSNTKKADEVHEYYVKLEEMLHQTINEENEKLQNLNKKLETEQNVSQNIIEQLNKKLDKKQRAKYELTNCVYIISNDLFKGYYKIGKSSSFNNRLNSYSAGAPVGYNVDYIRKVRSKREETTIENMVLQILSPYRVKNHMGQDREWLKDVDLKIVKDEMNNCIKFINDNRERYEKMVKKDENEIDEEDKINEIDEEDKINENEINEEDKINENETCQEEDKNESFDCGTDDESDSGESNNKKVNTKYNLENLKFKDKNDPVDFKKFIKDFCEVGNDDFFVVQTDLKLAFKIWSKTPLDMVEKQFIVYMNEKYKSTRMFVDNQRKLVFKGIKLKPLRYNKTGENFDFEEFIKKECVVNYLHKISYNDFFYFFTEWKKKCDPKFKLNKHDKSNIKKVLESFFCRARVLNSVQSPTKNLFGMLGLGTIENNYGLVEKKRQNKAVKEYDIKTHKLLKEYESIVSCARHLKIPESTFSNHIRNQVVIHGKYYTL